MGATYSNVISSVKNAVWRLRDHKSAVRDMNSILSMDQTSAKEIQSSLYGFSREVLNQGMITAASRGNRNAIQAFLNFGVVDASTIERALISAAKGYHWKAFSMLVPYASEDSFKYVPDIEHAYDNISSRKDLFQLVDKTRNYSMLLYSVLLNAIRTGKVDVVSAIFIRDSKLLHNDQVMEMLRAYFEEIVSVKELRNMNNIKDWIIVHGIIVADEAEQTAMVKYLLSLIDVSTENNLLLRAACFHNNFDLVNYALKNERVVRTGLHDAIRLSRNLDIRELLISAQLFFQLDDMADSNFAAAAA